ncbi:MAG: hypothetical protein WAP37_05765 [Solirubrobacterales bacterium]
MAKRSNRRWLVTLVAFAVVLAAPAIAQGAASWQKVPLPRYGGVGGVGGFEFPLGAPSDLQCWQPNRCILASGGNSQVANGLYLFNGEAWRQYATVCGQGNDPDYGAVVWAGPTEFWTITHPSQDFRSVGVALCRFSGGQVVGSYSTKRGALDTSPDPFRRMTSGACSSPESCWFGGEAGSSPEGGRIGSFHLYWDGTELKTIYAPARRGVSDIVFSGTRFTEALFAGPRVGAPLDSALNPIPPYRMLQEIDPAVAAGPAAFSPVQFSAAAESGSPVEETELRALDAAAGPPGGSPTTWAVGGAATSGPNGSPSEPADRGPFVAFRTDAQPWRKIEMPPGIAEPGSNFSDVAGIPGTDRAFATVETPDGSPFVVSIDPGAADPVARITRVPPEEFEDWAQGTGAARIECAAINECWMASSAGWMYHYSDPAFPLTADTAMNAMVTFRPNEVAEQAISDSAPIDDSLLFAPPPAADDQALSPPKGKRLKPAVRSVKSKLKGRVLTLSFRVIRPARLRVVARRKGRVVASAKTRLLKPGRRRVRLRLNPKRWPTRLSMKVTEPGDKPADDDETVTVPDAGVDNTTQVSAACVPPVIKFTPCIR